MIETTDCDRAIVGRLDCNRIDRMPKSRSRRKMAEFPRGSAEHPLDQLPLTFRAALQDKGPHVQARFSGLELDLNHSIVTLLYPLPG
jgi:hypothetical protein